MIADIFIKRPVTAIVVSIVIVLVGVLAMLNLPVDKYPDITPPTVSISGNMTGADAETIEQTTTTAIETQVNGAPGISYITSNSTGSGSSSITVTFDVGTDIDIATLDVQNRASVAEPTLPETVKRLGLTVRKRNPSIFMVLSIYSPNGTHDRVFIGNYANIYLKDALLRVKGVGDIFSLGDDFGMRIWLNPEKLAAMKLTPAEISAAIAEQNLQIAGGTVGGNPQPGQQMFEFNVLTDSRLNQIEDFENIIVRTDPTTGNVTYLKDVARVELSKFNYNNNAFINGHPAAYMLIYQAPGANALDTYNGIMNTLNEMKKNFPVDLDFEMPVETVSVIKVSINEVMHTIVEALILVIVVVFLFLQSWRATLIALLAIPVSLIGTFAFFLPFGFTINTLTLFAFILAIGIVVDDAIVVVEAVQHNIDNLKMNARQATERAMKEISAPVIAIALILAAVFVPVGFIPGIAGRLYQQFAITIAISVLISAFVALSLTPALCVLLLKPTETDESKKNLLYKFFGRFNKWFDKVSLKYTNGVNGLIKKTPYVLVFMVCVVVGLLFLFKNKATGFIPSEDEGRIFVTYELPEGASTTRSIETLREIQFRLMKVPGIKTLGGMAGMNIMNFSNKSNVGTIFVTLDHWDNRQTPETQVQAIIQNVFKVTSDLKEARVLAFAPPAIPGLGQSDGFNFQLQQTTSTDDIKGFEQVAQDFLAELRKRPEIGNAYTFFSSKTPAYQFEVDREMAKKMGVNVNEVYQTLSAYLGSSYVNDFNIYGRNFRVMMQADSIYRSSVEAINKFYVKNRMGEMVPLSAVAKVELTEAPQVISHYNIYRSIELNGTAAPGYSSGQAIQALQEVAAEHLPQGYSYEFSGMSREEIKAGSMSTLIFALSIVFVFLFLAALYESWSVPFAVLLAVPIGALGSIITLTFLPHLTNNIYAQIGLITLIGLAAKNAILIVEFAKERFDAGMDLLAATLDAVKLRLRPIIMTSLAFILGVVPLAFSSGAGSAARQTIGWTVLGGMLAASSLAIFIVPVLYVLITKISNPKKVKKQKGNKEFHFEGH